MQDLTRDGLGASRGRTEELIRTRILEAILERRLPPGEKLTEERLAELFGVSRTVVRQALARLAQDGVVEQLPNRGTFVAAPSRAEARHVIAARVVVEPAIAASAARNCACCADFGLRRHLELENAARRLSDRAALVRLTGEFHVTLARMAGNPVFLRLLAELQALTSLAILLYARGGHESCPPQDHELIVNAIERGEAEEAARLMRAHIGHVAADLDLDEPPERPASLADALGLPRRGQGRRRGVPDNAENGDTLLRAPLAPSAEDGEAETGVGTPGD